MPTVHFHGEVLPRVVSLSVSQLQEVAWHISSRELKMKIKVEIKHSKIHLTIRANKYSSDDFVLVHKVAFDMARTAVELAAFKMGHGLFIWLDTFIDPDGKPSQLMLNNDELARIVTAYNLQGDFGTMWKIVGADPGIFSILNDLIASITLPHVATVNCARAVDGIRHLIAGSGKGKQEWKKMHDALRVDRKYLEFVTEPSKAPRHGNRLYVDGKIVTEAVRRSWSVMNRFLEYKKRGNKPLPDSAEFPQLIG